MTTQNQDHNNTMIKELQEKLKSKDYNTVVKQCDALIGSSSTHKVEYYLFKAYALRELKQTDESQQSYTEGLKIFPGDINLLNDFSKLLILKGKYDDARHLLQNILKKDPEDRGAANKLKELDTLIQKKSQEDSRQQLKHEVSPSLNPLESAFNPSEIQASSDNLKKIQKLKLEKKLKRLPNFPPIEDEILAEEWLIAAKDALQSKYPELALKFCEYSALNNGNLAQTYGIAGDAYIELRKFNTAHLCYLIASENGDLESTQQLNLLSLAAQIGHKQLLEKRYDRFNVRLLEHPNLHQIAQKLLSRIGDNSTIKFDLKHGPINLQDLEKLNK